MITLDVLMAAGVQPSQARAFLAPVTQACERFSINTVQRIAAFLAQASHESAGFTRLEENLFYTTPERIRAVFPSKVQSLADAAKLTRNGRALANRVYANRLGNADEASGDGFRYRGRGLFQLTGRANYMAAGDALGVDYKASPDLVATPEHAAMTAAWFWTAAGCNAMADRGDIDGTTKRINGPAMLGKSERREHYEAARHALK